MRVSLHFISLILFIYFTFAGNATTTGENSSVETTKLRER